MLLQNKLRIFCMAKTTITQRIAVTKTTTTATKKKLKIINKIVEKSLNKQTNKQQTNTCKCVQIFVHKCTYTCRKTNSEINISEHELHFTPFN